MYSRTHTLSHANTFIYTKTLSRTHTHTHTHALSLIDTHTHPHLYTHSHTHTLTHTLTHIHTHYLSHAHTRAPVCLCLHVCGCSHACVQICACVHVCVCACVRVCVCVCTCIQWKKIKSWESKKFKTQYFDARYRQNPRHHFLCRAGSLTGDSPIVSCEKECSGTRDEGIYEPIRLRRLFVVDSRLLVLARIKTPKKKIIQNTRKCFLGHATNLLHTIKFIPNSEMLFPYA